jgi:hypothetical protein
MCTPIQVVLIPSDGLDTQVGTYNIHDSFYPDILRHSMPFDPSGIYSSTSSLGLYVPPFASMASMTSMGGRPVTLAAYRPVAFLSAHQLYCVSSGFVAY